ncbi:MAG: DUF3127 domain-containing protein [Lachnospiraceae bacterium]|nr:DUF3127 domain-containing protein [Lachnospiraceae bacterium]
MSVKVKGRIVAALPETSGTSKSGNAWRKREYVIETGDKYPKKIAFSVMNDNIEKCNLQYNEEVEVDIDIESREYNGKWYTSCSAWGVTRAAAPAPAPQPQYPPQQAYGGYPQQPVQPTPPADDLPF